MRVVLAQLFHIAEPNAVRHPSSGFALFRLGFRPFFLLGPLFGAAALGYFILLLAGTTDFLPSTWDAIAWHRHEMLFGYAGAIIAGFLLTAVPNWTGHPTPKGVSLALIVALWFAGRLMVFCSSEFPSMLVAAVDIAFFPACALGILPALLKAKNRRNYFFILLLGLLALANGLTHFGDANTGIALGLAIVILMMVIIGGRVIPFFTERALNIAISRNPHIERLAPASTVAALAAGILSVPPLITGLLCLLAAGVNGWRLSTWHYAKTLRTPLLWVLHAGYGWLIIGFAAKGAHLLGLNIPPTIATHAFTAGGIGVLTLGMMARVSLGHSGRPLAIGKAMTLAFACVNIAAVLRVFGVWLLPELTMHWLEMAVGLWFAGFGIFIVIYAPILIRPRVDGRDG